MSSTTWTQRAVASEAARCRTELWRAVEAQHVASTTRLVDNLTEHEVLEDILEGTKPPRPAATAGLHDLLATPFRYPPSGSGSRFRAPTDPGVFYGADEQRTACAELGYWRWRFLTDSAGLEELGPVSHTVFRSRINARAVDLRRQPFSRHSGKWTDSDDYTATQTFARIARDARIELIRYQSVRDPQKGGCGALLDASGFAAPRRPVAEQTWFLTVTRTISAWQRGKEQFEFRWA